MSKITIISSFYNADIYIDEFLYNVSQLIAYDTLCIHHAYNIIGSHIDNIYVANKLNEFASNHSKFKVIDIHKDPGLYELWNISARKATTKYLMTFNIDDRCSPEYIIKGLHHLKTHNADLVCSSVKVTKKKNAKLDDYDRIWYDKKIIYYDTRYDMLLQMREANVIKVKDYLVELKPNKKYKLKSLRIPFKYKKRLKVLYNTIILEDMIVDWNCDGKYKSFNIPHCTPIWKKSLHKYGYFNEKEYGVCADYEFWLRILKYKQNAKFLAINKPMILYLEDENSYGRKDTHMALKRINMMYYKVV